MRPDCDRRASACLTYDADTSEVWLQDPRDDDEPAQLVCSLHAGSLTAPLGWTVTDRRSSELPVTGPEPEEPLGGAEASADPEPMSDARRSDSQAESDAQAESDPQPVSHPAAAADSGPTTAAALASEPDPEPVASSLEDPDASPATAADPAPAARRVRPKPKKNSLLDRAFEWTGPQHSVLTTKTPTNSEEEAQENG